MPRAHLPTRHVAPSTWRRTYASTRRPPPPIRPPPPPQPTKPSRNPPLPPPKHPPLHTRSIFKPPPTTLPPRTRLIRNIGLLLASFTAATLGLTTVQLYPTLSTPCTDPHIASIPHQADYVHVYDDHADTFDASVALQEWLSGMTRRRKGLAGRCKGHVLEVSCGTGRNLGYFDIVGEGARVESLTFVDVSGAMVEVCRRKWEALFGGRKGEAVKRGLVVRFLKGDALGDMPLVEREGGERKYTTIVQTMGLCSTAEPVELVVNMVRHLDVEDPEARIWLYEHGRSYLPLWNRVMDNSAKRHAEIHGCWYNREIGEIVREAAERSGMEIVSERRYMFGTEWMYGLKPKPGAAKMLEENDHRQQVVEKEVGEGKGWLGSITFWK